jgi:o-succinylbenzoate synthase
MGLKIRYLKRELQFKFQALTSRGSMSSHTAYYLVLEDTAQPEAMAGVGESAPLSGLSPEHGLDFEQRLAAVCQAFQQLGVKAGASPEAVLSAIPDLADLPSIRFALETALLDLAYGGKKKIFDNAFSRSEKGIYINGLIWMGNPEFMRMQIREKLNHGFKCLKLKIGALDFETECAILREIRQEAGPEDLMIRLDANGAFSPRQALDRLAKLARFDVHSLEQPIRQGQVEHMARLCAHSPIPIALDEELISVSNRAQKVQLLRDIQPAYLILKPTLVGGFESCREWIGLAGEAGIGWWITSALESNIGLNAISQFVAGFDNPLPQGLGTGQLYHNNISSPLHIRDGWLYYGKESQWGKVV